MGWCWVAIAWDGVRGRAVPCRRMARRAAEGTPTGTGLIAGYAAAGGSGMPIAWESVGVGVGCLLRGKA